MNKIADYIQKTYPDITLELKLEADAIRRDLAQRNLDLILTTHTDPDIDIEVTGTLRPKKSRMVTLQVERRGRAAFGQALAVNITPLKEELNHGFPPDV